MIAAFFFLLGLIVGSFLNVLILRFGFSERAHARSACAHCNTPLAPYDLVPILSYLWLTGRCRTCGSGLSLQYPAVELMVGIVFVLVYLFSPEATDAGGIVLVAASLGYWASMVGVVVYDIRHTLIPMPFVYAVLAFALLDSLTRAYSAHSTFPLFDSALGAIVVGGFFIFLYAVTRGRGMGLGDGYIGATIGIMLGMEKAIVAAILGVWLGAGIGLGALLFTKVFPRLRFAVGGTRVTLGAELPFAPILALGTLIVFLVPGLPAVFGLTGLSTWFAAFLSWSYW